MSPLPTHGSTCKAARTSTVIATKALASQAGYKAVPGTSWLKTSITTGNGFFHKHLAELPSAR